MDEKLLKPYDAKATEGRIYSAWEASGYFNPDNLPARHQEAFCIMIAPPNVTGSLHMGHALENTLSDVIVRFERMRGKKVLWLPGTDHAGIATQNVVEKNLKKEGVSRHDLGREKFLEKIWEWKEQSGNTILSQLKQLGCSLDWSRTRFTMDQNYQAAVKAAFENYRAKDLIYQGERVINWCIKDQTALSDLELEYSEETGQLYYIEYAPNVIVATTRPETMLGDTAVAVNQSDERYKDLVGQTVTVPLVNRPVPIIADYAIDQTFGTGAVKVTPAHDMADSDIGQRHKLPVIKVINEVGKIINTGTEFDGLKIAEAREKIVAKLTELNLIKKVEPLTHRVAHCYRCNSVVESLLSKQWFLKMKPLAEKTLAAIKAGEVTYQPERWTKIAENWLENVRDWCISRQIWWGHQIPGTDDVFDTWFSSALWPLATLGWPNVESKDFKTFYPTQVITSARDILHLWIARMIFSGLEFANQVPFSKVIIHPTVLTKTGQRMSKSLGTGIDPLVLIDKYGADATRFGLLYQMFENQDLRFNEDAINMSKKFANKIWNITRFILTEAGPEIITKLPTDFKPTAPETKKLLESLNNLIENTSREIQAAHFGETTHALYDFVWKYLADEYIEWAKDNKTPETKMALSYTLTTILTLLHPFMPYLTEEIWGIINKGRDHLPLLIAPWPAHNATINHLSN
jgi:valyl-tRNA synthetase